MALTDENMVMPVTPILSRTIQEKGLANVLPALDELLDAVQVYNPKLYKSFLRKL